MERSKIPWLVDERSSLEEEAAPYRSRTAEEQLGALAAACQAAMSLLRLRDDQQLVLAHTDPLPKSAQCALARLRRQYWKARDRAPVPETADRGDGA